MRNNDKAKTENMTTNLFDTMPVALLQLSLLLQQYVVKPTIGVLQTAFEVHEYTIAPPAAATVFLYLFLN